MAAQAVDRDPQESRCHRMLALVCVYRRELATAQRHLDRALQLNPNDADAMQQMGYVLTLRGKPEDALAWMETIPASQSVPPDVVQLGPWHHALLPRALRRRGGDLPAAAKPRAVVARKACGLLRAARRGGEGEGPCGRCASGPSRLLDLDLPDA